MFLNFFFLYLFYFVLICFCSLFRKKILYKGIFYIFSIYLFFFVIYLIFNSFYFIFLGFDQSCDISIYSLNWFFLDLNISLKIDLLSYCFTLLVFVIGCCTNLYVLNYFKYEANEDIFSLLINFFIFSMVLLVLANNLFTLFLGWESIGIVSFFLINFWSNRTGTLKSSFKAFTFNRLSDMFLFIFIIGLSSLTQLNNLTTLNYHFSSVNICNSPVLGLLTISLLICSCFKSAQLFFHLWLPDSMEAPVPASALIHSATLVSAGLYLLLRFYLLIDLLNLFIYLSLIGSLTAAYGGVVSSSQTDMKKLLAYSTISHCGFLFVTLSIEAYIVTVVYLFLHGLFKASTFFCAGSFIRVSETQDTRQMGSLNRILPVDTLLILICSFNLGGLPFSIGYLYKYLFMTSILNIDFNFMILGFSFIGLLCSLVYSFRLVYFSCFDLVKHNFLKILFQLQQKQNNCVNYWSLTTYIQLIATSLVLLFSILFYIYFYTYLNSTLVLLDISPLKSLDNINFVLNNNIFYLCFYEIFYNIYFLIFLSINIISWRVEFTSLNKNYLIFNLFFLFFFILIFSFL